MDTDELIDVKERMEQPIDTNLSVMGQAEQLINQLESRKNIFSRLRSEIMIVNYAYKLDDMNKTKGTCRENWHIGSSMPNRMWH